MTVTTIVIAIVLIASVIAWTRTRRLTRGGTNVVEMRPRKAPPVEIWISLVPEDASKRDRIVNEIRRLGRIAPTASPTDILIEAEDGEKAMNEIRAALSVMAARATVSVTRAADGDVTN